MKSKAGTNPSHILGFAPDHNVKFYFRLYLKAAYHHVDHCSTDTPIKKCPPSDVNIVKFKKTMDYFRIECNDVLIGVIDFQAVARSGKPNCIFNVRNLVITRVFVYTTDTATEAFFREDKGTSNLLLLLFLLLFLRI